MRLINLTIRNKNRILQSFSFIQNTCLNYITDVFKNITHNRCQASKLPDNSTSVSSAPCTPSGLITTADCKSDILKSSWVAGDGVAQYLVEGRGNRGNASYVSYYSCTSNTSSCVIPGVACGESLTMTITAFNDICYSTAVLGQVATTGKSWCLKVVSKKLELLNRNG